MAPQTDVPGIDWPPIPGRRPAALMAMLYQLDRSQWLTPKQLRQAQFKQLVRLVQHAVETVPFYRDRLADWKGISDPKSLEESWSRIPILTRTDIQDAGPDLISTRIPNSHGKVHSLMTSGSTGQPVQCRGTQITQFFWQCITLRDHDWHKRDFSKTLAAIRYTDHSAAPDGKAHSSWGAPVDLVADSGPSAVMTTDSTISEQADWLRRNSPTYLIAYPSNIRALASWFLDNNCTLPDLIHIRSFGEILETETRTLCEQAWSVPIVDCYSSQEVGYVALECPDSPQDYHVQSESILVEILDDQGKQSAPGEVGRVVATPLHNAAMPLVRYDLGDFAEVGDLCSCGRGLPTLKRIVGRQRNMVTFPNGQQHWPGRGFAGDRGRNGCRQPPPAQIRTRSTTSYGSCC